MAREAVQREETRVEAEPDSRDVQGVEQGAFQDQGPFQDVGQDMTVPQDLNRDSRGSVQDSGPSAPQDPPQDPPLHRSTQIPELNNRYL